jgi:hypothetical protein
MLEKSNIPNKWKQHTHYTAYDALIHVCGKNRHQSSDFGRSGLAHVCIYSAQTTWLTCGLVHFVRYNYLCMYTCMYIWIGINSWKFMCVCMHGSMDACLSFMSCVCCMCVCVCVCVCLRGSMYINFVWICLTKTVTCVDMLASYPERFCVYVHVNVCVSLCVSGPTHVCMCGALIWVVSQLSWLPGFITCTFRQTVLAWISFRKTHRQLRFGKAAHADGAFQAVDRV